MFAVGLFDHWKVKSLSHVKIRGNKIKKKRRNDERESDNKSQFKSDVDKSPETLGLSAIQSVFYIYFIGIGLSVVGVCVEKLAKIRSYVRL